MSFPRSTWTAIQQGREDISHSRFTQVLQSLREPGRLTDPRSRPRSQGPLFAGLFSVNNGRAGGQDQRNRLRSLSFDGRTFLFLNRKDMSKLQVEHVGKSYSTRTDPLEVLRDCSLEMENGDQVAIIGPSGSGKSTLLHIIGTLDTPR